MAVHSVVNHQSTRARPKKQAKSKPLTEWQRTVARAKKQHAANQKRELAAQWRALKRIGAIKTTVIPSQKRLTKYRTAKIKKAFIDTQKQAVLSHGKVVRALQKEITQNGRIHYNLDKHFKLIKTKQRLKEQPGFRKTLKGYIVELMTPDEKVQVSKGKIIRKSKQGKYTDTAQFMTSKEIMKLYKDIKTGKFKLKENQRLVVKNFGGFDKGEHPYYPDALDLFVADMNKYRNTMEQRIYAAWLDMTEVRVITMN